MPEIIPASPPGGEYRPKVHVLLRRDLYMIQPAAIYEHGVEHQPTLRRQVCKQSEYFQRLFQGLFYNYINDAPVESLLL